MRVTVCQLSDDRQVFEREWDALADHVQAEGSGLVVLPELIFTEWFAESDEFDAMVWSAALARDAAWVPSRLSDLAPATVIGSRLAEQAGKRLNEAFIWTPDGTYTPIHHKTYLPEDKGFWEAHWFDRAPVDFQPLTLGFVKIGITICTEMWFMQHARDYGQADVGLIAAPRCTESFDKWLAGGQAAAVISGAFHLSSNRVGKGITAGTDFIGGGWIISPDGVVLATTSVDKPFVTLDIDLNDANAAKQTYPRYVKDTPI
jgi:N-carbamoylputrescine amidase